MKGADRAELAAALEECRTAFLAVAVMSGLVNLLYLTGSFFMLEVYDRVIPSRSVPTLIGLAALALALYVFQGLLEMIRTRILARVGAALDERLSARVFDVVVRAPLNGTIAGDGLLPLRDLDQIRAFLGASGPPAMFDLPWMPVYVAVCFLFHPVLGCAAIVGALVLVAVTLLTDRTTSGPSQAATGHGLRRNALAEAGRRNAEVLAAMGMQERLALRWAQANRDYMLAQQRVADIAGGFGTGSKVFRLALQSGVLALGAWLVINNEASAGIIIAASILVSRALAPAELAVANWKGFVAVRQSWRRLSDIFARLPQGVDRLMLPAPHQALDVQAVSVAPPGTPRAVVLEASFRLEAGQAVGVIGPSASGKSSLVRALVGVWPALRGKVRIDGAALDQWPRDVLGNHVGFLPQEVELFAGTVAETIARLEPAPPFEAVIAAARAAGCHAMIQGLPEGYNTRIGEAGAGLSAGQRQRIGLARALYRDPFLVVLDEPNSNLDAEGEEALTEAIRGVRLRGGICVIVAHRPSALAAVDLVLMMREGRVQAFGPKDEVLRHVLRPVAVPAAGTARPEPLRAGAAPSAGLPVTLEESA